jgi:hypothetical protein
LPFQAVGGRGGLFDEGSVLLRHAVDGFADTLPSLQLAAASRSD